MPTERLERSVASNDSRMSLATSPSRISPAPPAISDSPAVRSADQERETLPVASNEKGTLSIARRRKR
jgi:hypothetical protein